jgi:hypothetical protein
MFQAALEQAAISEGEDVDGEPVGAPVAAERELEALLAHRAHVEGARQNHDCSESDQRY